MTEWISLAASLGVLLALGYPLRAAGKRLRLPPALSLMVLGVLVGPELFDWLPDAYRERASLLSKAAFVVLLLRAGLGLALRPLRRAAPGVALLGLLPAAVELGAVSVGVHCFLSWRWDLALLAGFLIAAVSPAVILPTMLEQKEKARGWDHLVPDRIMGMALVNAFVAQTGILILLDHVLGSGESGALMRAIGRLPLALIGGVVLGLAIGRLVCGALRARAGWDRVSRAAPALVLAGALAAYFGANGLGLESVFATLAVGVAIRLWHPESADGLRESFRRFWQVAEVILFANLGAMLEVGRLTDPVLVLGLLALFWIAIGLRQATAWLSLIRSRLAPSERVYVTLAQIPKATVQAVFGPVIVAGLAGHGAGLDDHAQVMLVMAVLAICATAPIGAVVLDRWGERLLPVADGSSASEGGLSKTPDRS